MNSYHVLSVFLSFIVLKLYGQAPSWLWAKSGNGSYNDEIFALTATSRSQIVVGGEFYSPTLNLGSITLTSPSGGLFSSCTFIAAYDAQGNLLWAHKAGTSDPNRILGLASDTAGNIIAVGSFTGNTISFDGITLNNAGYADGFVVKYDPSGNPFWALAVGGSDWEYVQSVATDPAGNIYLTGRFDSPTLTLGPFTLINAGAGSSDILLAKMSPQGQVLWAYSFGGSNMDGGQSIAISPTGEIALTGFFDSPTLSIGSSTLSNSGQADIFVAKFDANGQPLWARKAAGTDMELPWGITIGPGGDIIVVGTYWSSTITFEGQTLPNQSTGGSNDLFVVRYDPNGQLSWVHRAGGSDSEEAHSVMTDTAGHIYVAGYFASPTISFGSQILTSAGGADVFVVAYDSNGRALWAQKAGGALYDKAHAMAMDARGDLYVGGSYSSSPATFGIISLPNDQAYDAFLAKLSPGTNALPLAILPPLRLIPMPQSGVYRVQATDFPLPVSWRLMTTAGLFVTQGVLSKPDELLDFSYLPGGMYLLYMDLPNGICVQKLLR